MNSGPYDALTTKTEQKSITPQCPQPFGHEDQDFMVAGALASTLREKYRQPEILKFRVSELERAMVDLMFEPFSYNKEKEWGRAIDEYCFLRGLQDNPQTPPSEMEIQCLHWTKPCTESAWMTMQPPFFTVGRTLRKFRTELA